MLTTASFLLGFSAHGGLTQKVDRGETGPQKVHKLIWQSAVRHGFSHNLSVNTVRPDSPARQKQRPNYKLIKQKSLWI